MDVREKLVELLCQATFGVNKQTIESYLPPSAIAEVADHLLANGVIVLPVKVGQKLYTIPRTAIREWTVNGVWISADPRCSYVHISWKKDGHIMGSRAVDFKDLNRTVFFSREEAEAALRKERQ